MHRTLGPHDIHAVPIPQGPYCRSHFQDPLPSGNADIAPALAALFGLDLPGPDGRALLEAIEGSGAGCNDYTVDSVTIAPAQAAEHFSFTLYEKVLRRGGSTFTYL